MIDDIIAEVCTEVVLLSTFASHVEDSEIATLERDEAVLLFELSLLAAHAQKVKGSDAGEFSGFCENSAVLSQHKPLQEQPQQKVPSRTESGQPNPHNWILEVLKDLTTYARANDLNDLAGSLESISDRNRDHLSANVLVDSAINNVSTENVVEFTQEKRSKESGASAP